MKKDCMQNNFEIVKNDYQVFLNFIKAKYPMFHNSNFFFRDLQFGISKFLENKGIKINNAQAAELAKKISSFFEEKNIFVKVNSFGWRVNYPEFVTKVPGDPI